MVYKDLISQFDKLSDDDKNALLIYKTRLGVAINDIDNKAIIESLYHRYKEILNNPSNLFIKMSILKDINFDSIYDFKISLETIKERINSLSSSLTTNDKLKVFRVFSSKEEDISFLSKDKLVSTSLNMEKCIPFFILNKGYKHYLYDIELDENSPVVICPYAILNNETKKQLTVTKKTDQEEIIFNKNNYDFIETKRKEAKLPNGENLTVISIKGIIKYIEREHKEKR